MNINFSIDPSSPSDLNAAVALLVKLGAVRADQASAPRVLINPPPVPALDPQDSPDAGLPVISPESAFASAPPAADLADAVAAFESTLPNVAQVLAPPLTTPVGTPPAPPNGVQTAGASTQANGVELDKNGLPWDPRIHAGTKGKNKDGSWTAKRNIDASIVPGIEAELRALMAIPTPGAAIAPPPPPVVTPPPPPVAAPVVTPPPVGSTVQMLPTISFPALLQKVAALVEGEKVLTQADIVAACATVGVPSLPLAASRPDLLSIISDIIDATAAQRRAGV